MESLKFILLLALTLPISLFFTKIIAKEKKYASYKILMILIATYFFIIYLPERKNGLEIIALMQLLLILTIPAGILYFAIKHAYDLEKEKRYLGNFPVIAQYEPPSEIHPAIAGFLIDREIGKREFFATLFNAITSGHIVIDERMENNEYKYYLLKNKGFNGAMSCDKLICDHVFRGNNENLDSVSVKSIKIKSDIFLALVLSELIKLEYFADPYRYYYLSNTEFINNREKLQNKWIKLLEGNFKMSIFFSQHEKERAKIKLDNEIKCIREYIRNLKLMPIKTKKYKIFNYPSGILLENKKLSYTKRGAQERAKWLGFKDYLQTAERFRLDEEKIETFSKYLPYAVALGVETEWTNRFENMDIDRVDWFRSQENESIRRHDDHPVKFKHLIRFMGRIYTK